MTDRITVNKTGPFVRFVLEADLLSQSTTGNYSVVRCYLRCVNTGNTSSFYNGSGFQAGSIDGVGEFARKSGQPFLPSGVASGANRWRLGPYDVKVPHNSNGTKGNITLRQTLSYSPSGGAVNESSTATINLPTIARATTPTLSPTSVAAGATMTIGLPRAASTFTHDLSYAFGGTNGMAMATGVGVSYAFVPPLSLLTKIPNATSGVLTVGCHTKSGSSLVGYKQVTGTLTVPESVIPTVSAVAGAEQNTTVSSVVGALVQGLSRVAFTVSAAGAYGSTIKSTSVIVDGQEIPAGSSYTPAASGNRSIVGKAVDSRGRTGQRSATMTVLAYSPPSVSSYLVRRALPNGTLSDDGTTLRVDLNAAVASLINGTQRNALTIRVATRPRGTTAWTNRNVITPAGLTHNGMFLISGGAIFDTTKSWDVRVTVSDKFGSYIADTAVATAKVTLDLAAGGVGVGKIHEKGALDVAGDIYQAGRKVVDEVTARALAATAAERGTVELATQAEVDLGTDATRAVTPGTLRNAAHGPYAAAAGTITSSAAGPLVVTFPSGRFNVPPVVTASQRGGSMVVVPYLTNHSKDSFSVQLFTLGGAKVAQPVDWHAIQMKATQAGG